MLSGSTWMRTGSSLRAERTRWSSPSARDSPTPWLRGTRRTTRCSSPLPGHRPQHLRALGQVEQGEGVVERSEVAGHRGDPRGRRQVGLGTLLGLTSGEAGRVPPDQRLQRGVGRVAHGDHVSPGAHECGRVEPASQRLLGGPHVVARQGEPRVEDQHGGIAGVRDRLGPHGGDDEVRMVADVLDDPVAARAAHRRAGEHPAQLLGGPGLAPHGRPQAPVSTRRAGPGGLDVAAPAALRRGGGPREVQRAGADPAAGRGAALLARQRGGVAGAGRLDEDRTGLQAAADRVVRRARDAGADRTVLGRRPPRPEPGGAAHRAGSPARGPTPTRPAAGPRGCGRSHPRELPCPAARRASAGPRGCAGRGRAARRGGRHRRPRRRPGRGRGPGRRLPIGCRRRPAWLRARRPGSRGSGRRDRRRR